MYRTIKAFSLIELMVGILITSFIMIAAFDAMGNIGIAKIKLIERTDIEKEAYYTVEKLFELIKTGGNIDYEEYWNRNNFNTTYASGHFLQNSGFGNFGTLYYCLSRNGTSMTATGCIDNFNTNNSTSSLHQNYKNRQQVYNTYKKQFIDYNADADADNGDEDSSNESVEKFIGDDDDSYLGIGPQAFPQNSDVGELYLINASGNERTFFRWSVKNDPYKPAGASCDFTTDPKNPTGSGCLGTIEFLKLTGLDEGYDHGAYANAPPGGFWDDDGEIDTWLVHKDFDPNYGANAFFQSGALAGTGSYNYWQPLFPETMHVSEVDFFLYPHKKSQYSWKDSAANVQVAPYVQLHLTLQPSWKEKRKIKGKIPEIEISTTIQLSPLDFQ